MQAQTKNEQLLRSCAFQDDVRTFPSNERRHDVSLPFCFLGSQLEEDGENPTHSDFYNWLRSNEFELTEQSRAELWQRRYECMRVPESLPRWLKCVKWSNRDDILQVEQAITTLCCFCTIVHLDVQSSRELANEKRRSVDDCIGITRCRLSWPIRSILCCASFGHTHRRWSTTTGYFTNCSGEWETRQRIECEPLLCLRRLKTNRIMIALWLVFYWSVLCWTNKWVISSIGIRGTVVAIHLAQSTSWFP